MGRFSVRLIRIVRILTLCEYTLCFPLTLSISHSLCIHQIWKLSTEQNHGRCGFDEFTSIMKLSHLAQSRIPLYIINVSKLIFYHPPLASTEFFEFSSIFSDLQKQQVLQNMVGFYNLPPQILDSDDRLMELEKKALRPFHPIHFEINAKVLIATFSSTISDEAIQELQSSVLTKLKDQMGFSNKQGLLDKVYVRRPSPKELGMTPAGPPGPNDGQQHTANHGTNHHHHGKKAMYNGNRGTNYNHHGNRHGMQPQPALNGGHTGHHGMGGAAPYNQGHHGQAGMGYGGNDEVNVHEMQQLLLCDDFWDEFRSRSEMDKVVLSSDEKIRTRQAMQMVSKLRNVSLKAVKFTDDGVKVMANKTRYELRDLLGPQNKDALRIKASLLGLSEIDIPHTLKQQQHHHAAHHQHPAHHHHAAHGQHHQAAHHHLGSPVEELYKGIVIEGLPELITNDDENIRKLDSAVLNEFIVSHIEVVDNVLRITFANEVTHKNINQLRKYLKSFLKDDIKLDKKAMKNVSIIPHTRDTWKGETTERSVEQHSNGQYIHVGDSITATPQQTGINPQHSYYNQ